jgi:antitoxin VapB
MVGVPGMNFLTPLIQFDEIGHDALNRCLEDWGHRMGPLNRPRFGHFGGAHGLEHDGKLVAVVATERMIAPKTCGLSREDAVELARVCAVRPGLCRVAVRLWREFVFPAMCAAAGAKWAISYQDATLHSGNLYRHDGWVRLGETRSGTDKRARNGVRSGRAKIVWGWTHDAELMAAARLTDAARQAEKLAKKIAA